MSHDIERSPVHQGEAACALWLSAGMAHEDLKHVKSVHQSAVQRGKEAGCNQTATDAANLDEVRE